MTFLITTVSNGPKVKQGCAEKLENYLERTEFIGEIHGSITASVHRAQDTGYPVLTLNGRGTEFKPVPPETVTKYNHPDDLKPEDAKEEQFMQQVFSWLEEGEQFVVQVVGVEKARFPVVAYQCRVDPDGNYEEQSLYWK